MRLLIYMPLHVGCQYREAGGPPVFPGDQTWPESSVANGLNIYRDADVFPIPGKRLTGLYLGGCPPDGRGQRDAEPIGISSINQHLLGQVRIELINELHHVLRYNHLRIEPGFRPN